MNFIYTFVALILVFVLQAQRCDVIHGEVEQVDRQISTFSQSRHGNISIPVIFHIVYRNSDQNISDAQILAQLDILNSIYDPASIPNNTSIPEEFRNAIDIPKIHFCLAQEDPDGNYSNGIIRKQTTINNIGCRKQGAIYYIMSENLGGSEIWNPSHYLNIFIGEREDCPLAEAIFPDLATNKTDGVVINPKYFGPNNKSRPFHKGYTLVHEIGHYLGLKHLTESRNPNDCNSDDQINDTPPQSIQYFGCPSHPQISCGTNSMFMNFMSLVDDECMRFFTKGQVAKMNNVIGVYRPYFLFYSCDKTDINPSNDFIILSEKNYWIIQDKYHRDWSAELTLFDLFGRLVWHGKNLGSEFKLISSGNADFSSAVYYLSIKQDKKNTVIKLPILNY